MTPSPSMDPASSVTFSSACWPWLAWLFPAPGSGGLTGRMSVAMVSVSIPLFSCISGQSSARQCLLAPWMCSGNSEIACCCPSTHTSLFFSIFDHLNFILPPLFHFLTQVVKWFLPVLFSVTLPHPFLERAWRFCWTVVCVESDKECGCKRSYLRKACKPGHFLLYFLYLLPHHP